MAQFLIGLDVGGTKTEACLLSYDPTQLEKAPTIIDRKRIHTERSAGLSGFLINLKSLIEQLLTAQRVSLSQVASIGVGLPGSIDPVTQKMSQGSITYFKNVDLVPIFKEALGYHGKIFFENDANCFALAETYMGAGRTWATKNNLPLSQLCLVGITLGTGVGGGLVVNGKLIRGRRGGAGEIGHITLIESGRACYCGKFGCSEQYLSGPAFEYAYASRASALNHLPANEIFKNAVAGDPMANAAVEYYRDHLVTFLSNISNFLDPHVIVLGGGLSNQKRIYPGLSDRLSRECFLTENPPAVLPNECGDSGGVLGAAMLGYLA